MRGKYDLVATVRGLVKFYSNQHTEKNSSLRLKILRERHRKLQRENSEQDEIYASRAAVVAEFKRKAPEIERITRQKCASEYPLAVAGLSIPDARSYGKRFGDSLLVEWQKLFDKFDA